MDRQADHNHANNLTPLIHSVAGQVQIFNNNKFDYVIFRTTADGGN